MRVLITRPREDAGPLAERLNEIGIETTIEPLLVIEINGAAPLDLDGVQAVLATSANGVRALAAVSARRDLPVLAVGDGTARAARAEGFGAVESAAGDVGALAALALARCRPEHGALLHVAGSHLAGDLGGLVEGGGLVYRRAVLYQARPVRRLSAETADALRTGGLDGVLFFSPRTADTFVSLLRRERLVRACRALSAFCLSDAVAERARAVTWRRVLVASRPDQESLLTLLTDGRQASRGTMTDTPKTPTEDTEIAESARTDGTGTADEAAIDTPGPATDAAPADESAISVSAPAEAAASEARSASRASLIPLAALTTLVLLAVVVGVLYAARPFWSPHFEDYVRAVRQAPVPDPRVDELVGRVAAIEGATTDVAATGDALAELERMRADVGRQVAGLIDRVDNLERGLEAVRAMVRATNLPGQAADARRALDALSDRLARLEQSEPTAGLTERLDRLDAESSALSRSVADIAERLETVEKERSLALGTSRAVRALVLAAGDLREALRSSAPFADGLAALREAAADQPDLLKLADDLEPHAAAGIPVLTTLVDRFQAVARRAVSAARQVEGEGWLAAAANRLGSLVTVRRTAVGDAEDTTDAAIARAEAALADGDLAAAVRAMEGLRGAAAEAAAGWLDQARARVLAERAMAVLHVHAVSLIAPAAPAGKPQP